jgi:hypothetical protein
LFDLLEEHFEDTSEDSSLEVDPCHSAITRLQAHFNDRFESSSQQTPQVMRVAFFFGHSRRLLSLDSDKLLLTDFLISAFQVQQRHCRRRFYLEVWIRGLMVVLLRRDGEGGFVGPL